jgi:diguanylate cyclase (GGDEF)-like protein
MLEVNMETQNSSNIYVNNFKLIPNFFDFIEADTKLIFGQKGTFIVFNIYNLGMINEEYGRDIGDICIKGICKSIKYVLSKYNNIYGYRFGNNDFIITIPNCNTSMVETISIEVESEYKKTIEGLSFPIGKLKQFTLEYNKQIDCVEDFYDLLFNNANLSNGIGEDSKRILRHIVTTFTNNIRTTLSSYRDANNLALTDDITGISNQRAGKLYISSLIEEHLQNEKGFSVMFIDGDNLKRYNSISYEAGNNMIKNISQIISNSIRSEDKVFRWLSGDEFLVVLKGTDNANSIKLAERVRESVEKQTQNYIYPTTISIGISNYPGDGNSIEEIINKAEKANSYAKYLGRNKVVKWDVALQYKR